MNLNAIIPDKLNDAFEKACIDRKVFKKQGVQVALQEFIEATGRAEPNMVVLCPICNAELDATAERVEVISTGTTDPAIIQVPPELKRTIEGVLDLILNPGIHHEDYRDFLLRVLQKRAPQRNVSAS